MAAAARLRIRLDHPWMHPRIGGWTASSLMARCAFFVLGAVAGGLTVGVFNLLRIGDGFFPAGLAMLIAAEWLILQKRLFHTGVEEVLWAGGLLAVVIAVLEPTGNSDVRSALSVALALAIAGFRLLNPLFITLAAVAASLAIDFAGGHRLTGGPDAAVRAGVFCYITGAIALFAGRIAFRRPSHDQMLNWLMVIMPLGGFLWLVSQHAVGIRVFTGLASAVFGAAALIIGLRRRTHAPLIACLVCLGCLAYQLRDITALSLKMKLIFWGSAALLLAIGLDRYLRIPRRGITSTQIGKGSNALELLQLAGAAALSPKPAQHADSQFKGGGGTFGGGGADGSY
jgi:hypothetical protein